EDGCGESHLIGWGACGSFYVRSGDEQEIGVDRIDAECVGAGDVERVSVNFFERYGLRCTPIVGDPVGVLHVAGEQRVRIDPAVQGGETAGEDRRAWLRAGAKNLELPLLILIIQIRDPRIVGRPKRLAHAAVDEILRVTS